jgi:predicted anti-sigma-YlaC factor YlaD
MCRSVARQFEETLDKDLSRAARRLVRKHLAQCPKCTAYFDSLKKTVLLYRCCPDPQAPARMRQKLMAILKLHN